MCSSETGLRQGSCASDLLRKCFWLYCEILGKQRRQGQEQSRGSSFRKSPAEGSLSLIPQGALQCTLYPLEGKGGAPVGHWLRATPAVGREEQTQAFLAVPATWAKLLLPQPEGSSQVSKLEAKAHCSCGGASRGVQVPEGLRAELWRGCDQIKLENISERTL